jgi:4-alpha-glucanotransferase
VTNQSTTSLRDGRHAGLLVPLFSMRSTESWGIGEFSDIPRTAAWLRECGLDILQLLPLNEMATGQNSPYCALSALALDPIYISLPRLQDFRTLGSLENLSPDPQSAAAGAKCEVNQVRRRAASQERCTRDCLSPIPDHRVGPGNRARTAAQGVSAGTGMVAARLRDVSRAPRSTRRFRVERLACGVATAGLGRTHTRALRPPPSRALLRVPPVDRIQPVAGRARPARRYRRLRRPSVYGVAYSVDVWVRQHQFDLDASVGVPPDAFNDTGQDWGLPVYRWDMHAQDDFSWLRERAQRCADLYDGYRVDHVVGFYRTYVIPRDGEPYFQPGEEAQQLEQGERLMQVFCSGGQRVIAEDLGTVPEFVRQSLARMGIPGLTVLHWARDFDRPAHPFRDPGTYPSVSVATTGTHDTEPMRLWWENASPEDRAAVLQLPELSRSGESCDSPFSDALRDRFVRTVFMSNADLVILPIQDVFGWRDRINVPGTVGGDNWTYSLPWPVDRLSQVREASEAAARMRRCAEASARTRHVSV